MTGISEPFALMLYSFPSLPGQFSDTDPYRAIPTVPYVIDAGLCGKAGSHSRVRTDFYEHLAEVFAFEEADKCLGSTFNAFDDRLFPLYPALTNPQAHIGGEPRKLVHVIEHEKPFQGQAPGNRQKQIPWSRFPLGGVIH